MNKFFTKVASLCVGLAMAAGVGVAVSSVKAEKVKAAEGDTVATFSSATVVGGTATAYTSYSNGDWELNIGGNRLSAGWNKTASNARQVGEKFAIDSTSVTSTTYGWVASSKAKLSKVGKLEFSYTGGSGNGSGKLWLASSTDGSTYSKVTLTDGTQGSGCGSTNTTYSFEFNTIESAYFAVIVTGGSSGSVFRFDSVTAKFIEGNTSSDPVMAIRTSGWATSPFELTYGDTEGINLLGYDPDNVSDVWRDGMTWSFSNNTVVNHVENADTWTYVTPKNVGTVEVTCSRDGYQDGKATIKVVPGTLTSITVTGSMSKTSYYVGENWSTAGLTATATYDSGYSYDATKDVEWSFNPSAPASNVSTVVASATIGTVSGSSSAQTVTVSRTNPIQVLYTKASGASVNVYGYYVGFLDGTGPVIMDGAYGIVIYNKTADVSGYTAGTTILHVTGSISIYKGLYEIGSASMSIASGTFDQPDTPVVYSTTGNETADYASRLTTVTGTPTLVSGSFDSGAGKSDIKMNFAVGTKTVQVFYKAAAQTADADAFAAIKAAVAASEEITIKGFTGWYDGFQVQMNGYVPESEGYTAEDFAQDLLNQTNDVCKDYVDGESSYSEFKSLLTEVWNDLASDDKYPSLPSGEKTILGDADRDESGTVVEQAMARYDYLTGKYELTNFINGRTPMSFSNVFHFEGNSYDSSATIIVVIVAITSITLLGTTLVIRKRKHQ